MKPSSAATRFLKKVAELTNECRATSMGCSPRWSKRVDLSQTTKDEHFRVDAEGDRILWCLDPASYGQGNRSYTFDELAAMRRNSDTKKVLLCTRFQGHRYEFVWLWTHWDPRGPDHWGVAMSPLIFEVRKDGEAVLRTKYKTKVVEFWKRLTIPGWEPKPRVRRARHPATYPARMSPKPGPTAGDLLVQVVGEAELYPRLHRLYVDLAPRVAAGETADDFWEAFMPPVEQYAPECLRRFCSYHELHESQAFIPVYVRRRAAWLVAERFCLECQLNPQHFQKVP